METCIKDLTERFAGIELLVSPPLVAFRESVVDPSESADQRVATGPKARPTTSSVGTLRGVEKLSVAMFRVYWQRL